MPRRLGQPRTFSPPGFSGNALKWMGFVFVCLGSLGAVVRRAVLGVGAGATTQELSALLSPEGGMMGPATLAVFCSFLTALAIPIYAKLLAVGLAHTSDKKRYLLRLGALALVSELPYDLCMSGKLIDFTQQNPAWALFLAAVALTIAGELRGGRSAWPFRALVLFAAVAWAMLLRTPGGQAALVILLSALFYLTEGRGALCTVGGILLSFLQLPAPIAMLFVYWYDGSETTLDKRLFYLLYPAQLLAFGLLGLVL